MARDRSKHPEREAEKNTTPLNPSEFIWLCTYIDSKDGNSNRADDAIKDANQAVDAFRAKFPEWKSEVNL